MKTIHIPIKSLSPEPADDGVEFMPMPREMNTFSMPRPPEPGPGRDVEGARDVLRAFIGPFEYWLNAGGEHPALDLAGLAPAALRVLNETLGEGEVAAIVEADHEIRIQETVFSGVWREQHFAAGGELLHDYLLAAPIPRILLQLAQRRSSGALRPLPLPLGAMNVPALVNEMQAAMDNCGPGAAPHVFNLSLLPLSPEDMTHLDALLAGGTVVILSRGFGNCRISSTAARHVWRVQYFNNMQTLILNTIEVVELPEVAVAAAEDLAESHARLVELVQWMSESLADAC
jgi:hydrogenase-1 operon protein HyaF